MTSIPMFAVCGMMLFSIGFYGVIICRHLLRRILALNLMATGVFLVLVALGRRTDIHTDPIPHAMVLTGVVVAVSATALALALSRRYYRETGRTELPPTARE